MNDPIKIILRYKNTNRRIQHHIYIYIGKVPRQIMAVLNKIREFSLYDTWVKLSKVDYDKMVGYYGDMWYRMFFNTYHINHTVHNIRKSQQQQRELIKKYGKPWYKTYIEEHKISMKKIHYTYDAKIKDEIIRREMRKRKVKIIEDDEAVNYTTQRRRGFAEGEPGLITREKEINRKLGRLAKHLGGDADTMVPLTATEGMKSVDADGDGVIDFDEGLEQYEVLKDETMELDEIEKLYQDMDVDIDKNTEKTSKLIEKALKDDKIFKTTQTKMVVFDTSKDRYMHDEQLKDNFLKHYVTTQYIFKDDTVKMIKNKICCSIKNNPAFGKNALIIPSRQYLWSEYYHNNKIERVMVGQKWIKRSNLLHIDVEPNNNIRIYEELRNNLKLLRDNIKRYGSKIKREDDDYNILYDYTRYYSNNELFLRDVYNEFGVGYSPDAKSLQNIMDVYIRIYFPRINQDDVKYIVRYVNGDDQVEGGKIKTIYENITNDLVMENQIMKDVEDTKKNPDHKNIFKGNYITQSVIHVNLRLLKKTKIDLFRIFNEFIMTDKYPFIQYQKADGQIIFKYSKRDIYDYASKKENVNVLTKWFENAPYGISFKVKIVERNITKFMAINLNETGRIEYKTQWKEDDMATIKDIKRTYDYVKDLIMKLNKEKNKVKIDIPANNEFKYAFINTIQNFELPEKFIINHNDLSEFSRCFYPHVALVIEPRKRHAKVKKDTEVSKFGTYLRYKRVSKYENKARIEQRILYFMRNYEYNDQLLANEISKQFNITIEKAMEEIDRVRKKYPKIKKSRKILKKLENIPKYKPPGIGIDIQGKTRTRYKIRISGARTKDQLNRIITFMNILIFLYVETYLYKRPERKHLKDRLKKLSNIAKRRNKVAEIVNYEKEYKTVKQMTQLDKKRIGFKPEKGQNQWTRSCQNSGKDKRRRPQQYMNEFDIRKKGFKFNKKNGVYERKVRIKKGRKKQEVIIRAVGLKGTTEDGVEGPTIYYTCDPDDNGEHIHIGFLSRSANPFGQCMPCCFKKDMMISKNKGKREYFMKCIGEIITKRKEKGKVVGDILYVLQDTNKIQEGRIGFLPKYLDIFLNMALGKTKEIKRRYLVQTKTGYYFKFGTRQDEHPFLNAVAALYKMSFGEIKRLLIKMLTKDTDDRLYTSINNGNIKTQFKKKEKFIKYIKTSPLLDFPMMNHFISIPGVLTEHGVNIIVFVKKKIRIRKQLEKEKIREDFVILCQNEEEIHNILDEKRDNIILIKENKNYYPIILVTKKNEDDKDVVKKLRFKYTASSGNIIHHIKDFYIQNCRAGIYGDITPDKHKLIAKKLYKMLIKYPKYAPKYQIIDARNKCKYIISKNNTLIPTLQSGSIYNLPIAKNIDKYLQSPRALIKNLEELYKMSNKTIPTKPIGLYYDTKTSYKAKITAIMTKSRDIVPTIEEMIDLDWIKKHGYILEHQQLYDKIDEEISKGKKIYIDNRTEKVNLEKYLGESYELFRLEFSEFINKRDNTNIKKQIYKIISSDESKKDKRDAVKDIIYKIVDTDLHSLYRKLQKGGFVHVGTLPDTTNYTINNNRIVCEHYNKKDVCNADHHCSWSSGSCKLNLTKNMIINFVNKISEELASNSLKASELLMKGDYFVSDIVNYNRYTERTGQKIVQSTNFMINKVLEELFGEGNVPIIGKRRTYVGKDIDYFQLNAENPLKSIGNIHIQRVIENNLSIFRAYANSYYWIKQVYYEMEGRNLGYYGVLQTNLANYFKSVVIDWLVNKKNSAAIKDIIRYMELDGDDISEFIFKMGGDIATTTNCIVELYVLNKVYNVPIYVYDNENKIIYIFNNGIIYNSKTDPDSKLKKYKDESLVKKSINIQFILSGGIDVPVAINSIYYT